MSERIIEKIHISDITPAEYNPRILEDDEYEKLSRSIGTFGLVDPIIINLKNNKIIGGHQRYQILYDEYIHSEKNFEDLSLIRFGDIGWVFLNTDLELPTENDEKALNIALNKISGEWDYPKLNILLGDLSISGFDVTLTGFENLDTVDLEEDLDNIDIGDTDSFIDVQKGQDYDECFLHIGFENRKIANKFLRYLGYPQKVNDDVYEFSFSELGVNIDQLIEEREARLFQGEEYYG